MKWSNRQLLAAKPKHAVFFSLVGTHRRNSAVTMPLSFLSIGLDIRFSIRQLNLLTTATENKKNALLFFS